MSDALSIPPRPHLDQYKKLARDFQHACQSANLAALRRCVERWSKADPQAESIEQHWQAFQQSRSRESSCTLACVQLFLAREHGFASWPKFARHIQALAIANSPVSNFERATGAIIDGDIALLQSLLQQYPELIHERSTRQHRSTLLHYVSANGVEDFRQKTPANIVAIAELLIHAGADVNSVSEAYGGSTPLGLAATSGHPENAGVQLPLLELLLANGAEIDAPHGQSLVVSCLRNGRGAAAEFLAERGARLGLEAAAGVGRFDLVKSFFGPDRALTSSATPDQMRDGFARACQFGRESVVEFLLQQGMELDAKLPHYGETGLHCAAFGGHANTVKLLLDHGASVAAQDGHFAGTALAWALYAWSNSTPQNKKSSFYHVVAHLVHAGAEVDPSWIKSEKDPLMRSALLGVDES